MQRDANEDEVPHPAGAVFSRYTKDRALKILLDYSADTGRKWTKIRDEIVTLTGAPDDPERPTLSRQSLELWARRKSDLGDAKFFWVHKFLTHPVTLARSDIRGLGTLDEPIVAITATGNILLRFSDVGDVRELGEIYQPKVRDVTSQVQPPSLAGLYEVASPYADGEFHLSLTEVHAQKFMIAHLLLPRRSFGHTREDWNMDRMSGYAIPGPLTTLYLKHRNGASLNIVFGLRETFQPEERIFGRMNANLFDWVEDEFAHVEGPPARRFVHDTSVSITRKENSKMQEIVENFLWSVQF